MTGADISVTTWNDTREQRLLTQVWVGPETEGITVSEGYDSTTFDQGNVTNAPGSYNYTTGATVSVNNLDLGRTIENIDTLWVTLNGRVMNPDVDYTVVGTELILSTGILQVTDVVICTQTTDSVVPEAMEFRIFQDLRQVQATYRMTPETTTTLTQALTATADIIHVADAGHLSIPNFAANIWGVITINGERIMYRNIDFTANTVSSLLRGTAGTAAASHLVGAEVYDMGRGNLMPLEFQNYIVSNTLVGDGTTTVFTAESISLVDSGAVAWSSSTAYQSGTMVTTNSRYYRAKQSVPANILITNVSYWQDMAAAVEVYVGGTRIYIQNNDYIVNAEDPVQVTLAVAPPAGVDVTILVRRGVTWYAPGYDTPSDGVPLQETNTAAARFLRGL